MLCFDIYVKYVLTTLNQARFGGKYHCYQTNPVSQLEICAAYLAKLPE